MRVMLMAVTLCAAFCGCSPLQHQIYGMQVAMGPCRSAYVAWRERVEKTGQTPTRALAAALLQCLRSNGVQGPIALVTSEIYGATPPPRFGPGQPRNIGAVSALSLTAYHYSP